MIHRTVILILSCLLLLTSCKKDLPLVEEKPPPVLEAEAGEELSGGQVSVRDATPNAFGFQAAGLADFDQLLFFVGNSFFNQKSIPQSEANKKKNHDILFYVLFLILHCVT